jgi:uncharacterized membrane protein
MRLLEQIEQLRTLLYQVSQRHSLTTEEVLQISQQLDKLIVIKMRMDKKQ